MNRYSGKDRPGRIHSPNGPLGSHWAYPPGIAESGVGLLETITGLVVFLILAMVGAKAFRGVMANQMEPVRITVLSGTADSAGDVQGPAEAKAPDYRGSSGSRITAGNGSDRNASDRRGSIEDSRGGRE